MARGFICIVFGSFLYATLSNSLEPISLPLFYGILVASIFALLEDAFGIFSRKILDIDKWKVVLVYLIIFLLIFLPFYFYSDPFSSSIRIIIAFSLLGTIGIYSIAGNVLGFYNNSESNQ